MASTASILATSIAPAHADTMRRDAEIVRKNPQIIQRLLEGGRHYNGVRLPVLTFSNRNLSLEELYQAVNTQLASMRAQLSAISDSNSLADRAWNAAKRAEEMSTLRNQISAIECIFAPVQNARDLLDEPNPQSFPIAYNHSVKRDS